MKKLRVGVIYGGRSGEHDVSLRSGQAIMKALNPDLYEVVPYLITGEGKWRPKMILPEPGANPDIDVVFPVLHGTFGEDGTVQGLLELADLPYVGAGVFASSASMDKELSKRLCLERGLPVVEYEVLRTANPYAAVDVKTAAERFGFPLFVKPACLGSSVGVSKAKDMAELEKAVDNASRYDSKVIVERAIEGQELECAVLGNHRPSASTPCEILPSREFYDYDDKYILGTAQTVIPPNLSPGKIEEVRALAVACFQAVECSGMARVDFLVERASGKVYINEINTIPGFTSISMFPKMWEHAGMSFAQLVETLIDLAIEHHGERKSLRYER